MSSELYTVLNVLISVLKEVIGEGARFEETNCKLQMPFVI